MIILNSDLKRIQKGGGASQVVPVVKNPPVNAGSFYNQPLSCVEFSELRVTIENGQAWEIFSGVCAYV